MSFDLCAPAQPFPQQIVTRKTPATLAVGDTVVVTGQDLQFCIDIGTKRQEANRREERTNLNFSGRDDTLISIQGVIGEWAFNALTSQSQEPLTDTRCRNAAHDTYDATIQGRTIDVKAPILRSKLHRLPLLVSGWKAHHAADAYVLLYLWRPDEPDPNSPFRPAEKVEVGFVGAAHHGRVFAPACLSQRRGKTYYEVPLLRLTSLQEALSGPAFQPYALC